MGREAQVKCWHCGGQGHVKADCAKLFKLELDIESNHAGAVKDDDARSDSTMATATDRVAPRQRSLPVARGPSGCHYCGAEGHTAQECKERLVTEERCAALGAKLKG